MFRGVKRLISEAIYLFGPALLVARQRHAIDMVDILSSLGLVEGKGTITPAESYLSKGNETIVQSQ